MLNKEKYAKEIMDVALKHDTVALVDGKVCSCNDTMDCHKCFFHTDWSTDWNCDRKFIEWSNSEYKETEIDWSKVPVDTPIVVRDRDWTSNEKLLRHFAKFKNNKIYAWTDGRTSYTIKEFGDDYDDAMASWDYAEIAEGVNCSEWYKD